MELLEQACQLKVTEIAEVLDEKAALLRYQCLALMKSEDRQSGLASLDKAIKQAQEVVNLSSKTELSQPARLTNLAFALNMKYLLFDKNPSLLDEAKMNFAEAAENESPFFPIRMQAAFQGARCYWESNELKQAYDLIQGAVELFSKSNLEPILAPDMRANSLRVSGLAVFAAS